MEVGLYLLTEIIDEVLVIMIEWFHYAVVDLFTELEFLVDEEDVEGEIDEYIEFSWWWDGYSSKMMDKKNCRI